MCHNLKHHRSVCCVVAAQDHMAAIAEEAAETAANLGDSQASALSQDIADEARMED